jgi:hypothetical protein
MPMMASDPTGELAFTSNDETAAFAFRENLPRGELQIELQQCYLLSAWRMNSLTVAR